MTRPAPLRPTSHARSAVGLVGFVALAFAAGGLGSWLQGPSAEVSARYAAFALPTWAPPAAAFGIVWPVLYLLIGLAGWRVWRAAGSVAGARGALGLWSGQLAINALWPGVFFGLGLLGLAAAVIVVLALVVVASVLAAARHDRLAAWLLVPYLAWLLYAGALNIAIWTSA